jgi:predicted dehydrogenase
MSLSPFPVSGRRFHGIAVVGAGVVISERHLPGLAKTGRGVARSIFDPDRERARALAAQFDIPRVADSLEDALAGDDIDAVLVASPNSFHREGAEAALAAGKHVLCEKPIALRLADAGALRDAARAADRVLQVGFHQRFSAEHAAVRLLLDAGVVGRVEAFDSVVCEPAEVIPGGRANYRYDPVQGGGLTLIDLGSHRVDQLRALLGEVAEVYCRMASKLDGHGLDDSVTLSLRLGSGALGTMGFHRFSRGFFSPCMLAGTRALLNFGAAVVNPFQSAPVAVYVEEPPERALPPEALAWTRPRGWWGESPAGWIELWPPRRDTFERQWTAFFDRIEGLPVEVPEAEDGYRALEIVHAAYLSHAENRAVALPLDPAAAIPPPRF